MWSHPDETAHTASPIHLLGDEPERERRACSAVMDDASAPREELMSVTSTLLGRLAVLSLSY
jgi:hypothetical protein